MIHRVLNAGYSASSRYSTRLKKRIHVILSQGSVAKASIEVRELDQYELQLTDERLLRRDEAQELLPKLFHFVHAEIYHTSGANAVRIVMNCKSRSPCGTQ